MKKQPRTLSLEAPRPEGLDPQTVGAWESLCARNPTVLILFEWGSVYLALNDQAGYLARTTGQPLLFAEELEFCEFPSQELPDLLAFLTPENTVLVCGSLTDPAKQYYT